LHINIGGQFRVIKPFKSSQSFPETVIQVIDYFNLSS